MINSDDYDDRLQSLKSRYIDGGMYHELFFTELARLGLNATDIRDIHQECVDEISAKLLRKAK